MWWTKTCTVIYMLHWGTKLLHRALDLGRTSTEARLCGPTTRQFQIARGLSLGLIYLYVMIMLGITDFIECLLPGFCVACAFGSIPVRLGAEGGWTTSDMIYYICHWTTIFPLYATDMQRTLHPETDIDERANVAVGMLTVFMAATLMTGLEIPRQPSRLNACLFFVVGLSFWAFAYFPGEILGAFGVK